MQGIFRSVLLAGAVLAFVAPASAGEVRDVLVLPGGEIWIALDGTPHSLTAQTAPGRLEVALDGWSAAPRTITPYAPAGFSHLSVSEAGFAVSGPFETARAELREGGVLIALTPGASMAAPAAEASSAPVDDDPSAPRALAVANTDAAAPAPGRDRGASVSSDAAEAAPENLPAVTPEASSASALPDQAEAEPAGPCQTQATALSDAPWDLERIVDHAECLAEAGERRNAAGLYERVLAFQPEHFRAALGLARLRELDGRYEDAARLFETAAGSALTDGEALAAQAAARRARDDGRN